MLNMLFAQRGTYLCCMSCTHQYVTHRAVGTHTIHPLMCFNIPGEECTEDAVEAVSVNGAPTGFSVFKPMVYSKALQIGVQPMLAFANSPGASDHHQRIP